MPSEKGGGGTCTRNGDDGSFACEGAWSAAGGMAARLSEASPGLARSQAAAGIATHVAPMSALRTHPAYQRYVILNETVCAVYGLYRYPE